jgi:hypothetical protein
VFYTYAHYRKDSDTIFYIGKGKEGRASSQAGRNGYWKAVATKHGFEVKILARWHTEVEALDHEVLLISCLKEMGYQLTNLTDGGEGASGAKRTIETRKKMSLAQTGKTRSKEAVEKIASKLRGRKHTEEHKRKISLGGKGRVVSDETKERMSAWQKGKPKSEKAKANMRKPKRKDK